MKSIPYPGNSENMIEMTVCIQLIYQFDVIVEDEIMQLAKFSLIDARWIDQNPCPIGLIQKIRVNLKGVEWENLKLSHAFLCVL